MPRLRGVCKLGSPFPFPSGCCGVAAVSFVASIAPALRRAAGHVDRERTPTGRVGERKKQSPTVLAEPREGMPIVIEFKRKVNLGEVNETRRNADAIAGVDEDAHVAVHRGADNCTVLEIASRAAVAAGVYDRIVCIISCIYILNFEIDDEKKIHN